MILGVFVKKWISGSTTLRVLGLAAVVMIVFSQGCNGPPLKPWHTAALTEEFTAAMADKIRTYDDYKQLEDRLFAQLEKRVYANTGTGPEFALVRYSAGSAADPQRMKPNWNRSFDFPAESPTGGVLLVHGMSDSPYSLRALGEALKERDYWVLGLRLPGHGTAPSGLKSARWQDMAAAVHLAMEHLESMVGKMPIYIVGYSTGAPLAIDFTLNALEKSASPVPAGLVLISPAIGIHAAAGLARSKEIPSFLPGLGGLAWLRIRPEFDPYKYNSFAINAGYQVHRLTRSIAGRIKARVASGEVEHFPPTLVFLSTADATVSTDAVVNRLLKPLASRRHELVLFDINRFAVKSPLLVSDPGPMTTRLMADRTLPFPITLVGNETPETTAVVSRYKAPFSIAAEKTEPLNLFWPMDVISLSHVALPFPPDDPLYGQRPPANNDMLFLGQMAIQGERGLLKIPSDWLLRLKHNPFYGFLEARAIAWMKASR